MPQVKPVGVHSCSPSHENFPASNLLVAGKWKCRDQGQKKAWVVLELAEPTEIDGIDIGNEHSCFIEALVGRKGDSPADFKEILLTSSFQTPNESRNSENPNRVRCFSKPALVESNASKKWELLKLACTQPFNSRVHYGISFVTIYAPDESKKTESATVDSKEDVPKKGLFSLRDESPESDSNSTSLFSRWKKSRENGGETTTTTSITSSPATTAAAAIRDARKSSVEERKSSPVPFEPTSSASKAKKEPEKPTTTMRDRNRSTLMYDDSDEEKGDDKLEKLIEKDKKRAEEQLKKDTPKHKKYKTTDGTPAKKFKSSETEKVKKDRPEDHDSSTRDKKTHKNHDSSSKDKKTHKDNDSSSQDHKSDQDAAPSKPKKPKTYKPFKTLLEGVVLTISGIQNPERGTLRSKALEMGAKYRGDWDDSCTHLICAFQNTPKYNQVHGIGKIVRKDWVLECHKKRKHLPWRRFALDKKEGAQSESEEEIWDEADKIEEMVSESPIAPSPVDQPSSEEAAAAAVGEEDDDVLLVYDKVDSPVVICDSGSDTEDEIEKVRSKGTTKEEKQAMDVDVAEPVVDDTKKTNGSANEGEFLTGKKFYLDEDNGAVKIIKCNSIITKYGGEVIECKETCDYWIKLGVPGANLLNKDPPIIRPLWLEESADMECMLPIKRYRY